MTMTPERDRKISTLTNEIKGAYAGRIALNWIDTYDRIAQLLDEELRGAFVRGVIIGGFASLVASAALVVFAYNQVIG